MSIYNIYFHGEIRKICILFSVEKKNNNLSGAIYKEKRQFFTLPLAKGIHHGEEGVEILSPQKGPLLHMYAKNVQTSLQFHKVLLRPTLPSNKIDGCCRTYQ